MHEASDRSSRPWYSAGIADALFVGCTLLALFHTRTGAMDDPGLGWHLRIADQMWESGGFLYREVFCLTSEGRPWVTYCWLGDVLLRLAYGWAGLNGIAILFALCVGLFLRVMYTHMVATGVPWFAACGWALVAAGASRVGWTARPNMYTFVGLALTVAIVERFHRGDISRRQTLWLLPLFLFWANMHSGFLAGALVLGVTWLAELSLSLLASESAARESARGRLRWWTCLGVAIFLATLVNPYGPGLYTWTVSMVGDPFIQQSSTTEWRSPDFTAPGWNYVELLVLFFPLLTAISNRKLPLLPIALSIVWLHFALTGIRYAALWVIVVVPTLAWLSCDVAGFKSVGSWIVRNTSEQFRARFRNRPGSIPFAASIACAVVLMVGGRWLPPFAMHHRMPAAELNELLRVWQGERVFHSANWGGYLTWHGWNRQPRFRPWIDDRIDVHGRHHTEEYFNLIGAAPGWSETLERHHVDMLALPISTQLARAAADSPQWRQVFRGEHLVIFRRAEATPDEARERR
jgi:hypothetical protein